MVYIVGILAAIAIPAYRDYTIRTQLTAVVAESRPAREQLAAYYLSNHRVPETLEAAGVATQLADGSAISLDPKRMALTVTTKHGELVLVPADSHGQIVWTCTNGQGLKPAQLPPACRSPMR
jgi:Tfp pilus assembly major pilin PilA